MDGGFGDGDGDRYGNERREVEMNPDEIKRMYEWLQERMREDPDRIPEYTQILSISRHLERIADQSTNVAEDVIFTVEGELVRHGGWEQRVEGDEGPSEGPQLRAIDGGADRG